MAAKKAYESRAEEELAEWGTYRATARIVLPGYDTPAFLPGHMVPVSHVERYGLDDLVERVRGEDREQAQQKSPFVPDGEAQ